MSRLRTASRKRHGTGTLSHVARLATVTVRMAPELHARIKRASAQSGVTMNVWMVSAAQEKIAGRMRHRDMEQLNQLAADVNQIKRILGIGEEMA